MSAIQDLAGRGAAIVEQARKVLDAAPPNVKGLLKTGAALGVARTGARVAGGFVRRNPGLMLAAAVVGAGVLAYSAYRKRAAVSSNDAANNDAIEGEAVEVPAQRVRSRKPAVDTETPKPRVARKRSAPKA
jgi:uncharacterized membrane protein YdfJ with MMPL/SSD domain